jgi:hypothetical protein
VLVLESILLVLVVKIVLQHILGVSGRTPDAKSTRMTHSGRIEIALYCDLGAPATEPMASHVAKAQGVLVLVLQALAGRLRIAPLPI